ncbi:sulfate adenylyltransferase subunit CysN [Sulfurovum sp. bin170]|uniref:sulfate adenylyltransferase subunit CysN n=1 Tax=Sulfurovum sp. bin170 TaxID=2695268 RepID=UPI0013DF720F|nr:sulfate adenylyltransferase subunit CysN [Sulfurovum sp. bin170]NEW60851.1 sulfate adenylyltransferase subunit CysN [Sulfurovum sp. bin170]
MKTSLDFLQNSLETETLVPNKTRLKPSVPSFARNSLLKFITCGSVDDGKSTLIGRLLYDSNSIFTDQMEALCSVSKKYGTQQGEIDFALLVDGLSSEREQGITIDVAYRYFNTPKRKFILADTPGHEQYTRNMATGASGADVAVILIDATKGVSVQTNRHTYITTLFGVKDLIVAINKMDLINYSQDKFETIKKDFLENLKRLNIETSTIEFIPICATNGENVVNISTHTLWYRGKTLLEILETIPVTTSRSDKFRFPIQYINRPNSKFRGYTGTVANGVLKVGDKVKILPSHKTTTIKEIITYDGSPTHALKGDAITLTLSDEIDISRGDTLVHQDDSSIVVQRFEAMMLWMDESELILNQTYQLNLTTVAINAKVTHIEYIKDMSTLQNFEEKFLKLNDIAKCTIELESKILVDRFQDIKSTGSFILIDKISCNSVGAGVVVNPLTQNNHIFLQNHTITKSLRAKSLHQKPFILWLTGLSASGKSTLANEIEKVLYSQGFKTYLLDGDNLRDGLNNDLDFTQKSREENIRRVAHLSQIMVDAGLIVITAFISPFRKDREFARSLVANDEFIEAFLDTPLDVCEQRDKKGLYQKAKDGIIKDFTGISSPYERPLNPEITINNASIEESLETIILYLQESKKCLK